MSKSSVRPNGKGAHCHNLRRDGGEAKALARQGREIRQMLDDRNAGREQHGMNWPTPAGGVIDIRGVIDIQGVDADQVIMPLSIV